MLRALARKTARADERFQLFLRHNCEVLGFAVLGKEFFGDDIDALIRALCREYDRDEQLEIRAVIKFAMRVGVRLFEQTEYSVRPRGLVFDAFHRY